MFLHKNILFFHQLIFLKFLDQLDQHLHSIPNFFNVCVNKLTVPPYKSVELIKLSPD